VDRGNSNAVENYQDDQEGTCGGYANIKASSNNKGINTDMKEPWEESEIDGLSMKVRELTDKANRLGKQPGLSNGQGTSPADGHLPYFFGRPPIRNAATSQGQIAIAHQASSIWDSTLAFPAGAIITDVVSCSVPT
jgi:hypothetical protein